MRDHSSSILCEFRCSQDGGHTYVHAVVHTARYSIACWISKTDIPCRSRGLGQTPVDWNDLDSLGYAPGSILRPRVCLLPLGILFCRITRSGVMTVCLGLNITVLRLPFLFKVKFHLSGLIGTASHPDMQKILIVGLFCAYRLHWQFAVRLLLFTVCTCV